MKNDKSFIIMASEKAGDFIENRAKHNYITIPAEDIPIRIKSELDRSKSCLIALVFIDINEYNKIDSELSSLPSSLFTYQYVIFGPEEQIDPDNITRINCVSEFRSGGISQKEFDFIVKKSFVTAGELLENRIHQEKLIARLLETKRDQDDLIDIGRSLTSEKDPEKLLRLILYLSKRITGADAGSIYLVEKKKNGKDMLRFKYSHTFSREIPLEEYTMEMNKKSIAGYVAVTGAVLNIPDVYSLPEKTPYIYNSSFDIKNNYRCKSMLVVPMKNNAGDIIGVIQLINRKEARDTREEIEDTAFTIKLETPEDFEKYVYTFDKKYDSLLEAIAGQAAAAIENNRLIKQIQEQFEEFVKASVTAIESRDPATSGHSFRVAAICREIALAVNEKEDGYLADFSFSDNDLKELEYAALLHDFGKVYIDLSVFTKAKKLYPGDFENLNLRLSYLYRYIELDYACKESKALKFMTRTDETDRFLEEITAEKDHILQEIRDIKDIITSLNEPSVTNVDPETAIKQIREKIEKVSCTTIEGKPLKVITENDRINLCIKRGSLNPEERREIETHVVHTYNFVSKIPWPPEYDKIPDIALRHHEKLNGSGYPDRIEGRENIPIQARIMAIADIFDALAAADRPYKNAVPIAKTLEIIKEESERGLLDPDLVDIFIVEKIYEKIDLTLSCSA